MWLDPLLELIFPPACEVCRNRSDELLCPECYNQIKFMKPHMGVHSAAVYEGVIKTAIHRFKFQKKRKLAEPLGILLVKYLTHLPHLKMKEIDSLVPVPLHARRRRARGFNQAELLADVIGRYFEVPVARSIERVRDTEPQFGLPREKRLTNLAGAFRVANPKAVYKKKIMLIDDIYTTGSTAAECSRIMKVAGAKEVAVLTLARALEM